MHEIEMAGMHAGSQNWELPQRYGNRVHILDNVFLLSALARIGSPKVAHRDLMALLRSVYQSLLVTACGRELPRVNAGVQTRMAAAHPRETVYRGPVLEEFENLVVYTARLDRGLSDPEVLSSLPGTHWDREKGLDLKSYIVPGAGGMGEVINNSWC